MTNLVVMLVIVAKTHLTVLSAEPDTASLPFELIARQFTSSEWPSRVDLNALGSIFQILRTECNNDFRAVSHPTYARCGGDP